MIAQQSGSQEPRLIIGAVALCFFAFVLFQKISVYLAQRRFMKENGCQPIKNRYPLKDPFLGLDIVFENVRNGKAHKFLEGVYRRNLKYGPTFAARLTTTKMITTTDPDNIKTVLSLRFKDYSLGNRGPMQTLFGLGIFTTDGERWSNSRHMIRPNFARDQVADLTAFERHVQDMFKLIPRDGSTVDLQELFFRLTIDSATEFLFGESVDSLKNDAADFAQAFNYAQHEMAMLFRLGVFRRFRRNNKRSQEAVRICHEFVDKFVDDAVRYRETHDLEKAPKEEKYVFLHELAKFTGDKRRLRDELLNVLLAGRDTTASLLSNMFFELAKRPEVFAKLRAEVEELNGRTPTYEQLRNMKYLKWCMNESLRIHPVVPGNSRLAIHDTVLPHGGGPDGRAPIFVPKGTLVGYSVYTMHRRVEFYGSDAEEWRPERWETLRPSWEYLPFNGGPRICLGQQYALTEAGYVTVRMLQEFKAMEDRDGGPWEENLTLTLCSRNGTKVGLTPA